jgi:hypothetical protein
MTEDRNEGQHKETPRKARLSPELTEFLHMLKALETRGDGSAKPN